MTIATSHCTSEGLNPKRKRPFYSCICVNSSIRDGPKIGKVSNAIDATQLLESTVCVKCPTRSHEGDKEIKFSFVKELIQKREIQARDC
jgi:hypothetical protein